MCGISGILKFDGSSPGRDAIRAMADALVHRGPDDDGFYLSKGLAFGFRRLSIIDLSTGSQPIHNEDKTVWVMLNGEIYDFQKIRAVLEGRGHSFHTRSDTEIIVHLYEEYGETFLEHLNGMFSLALWDDKKETLILARDRMGKKPLYYCQTGTTLLFASEIKSLLRHPDCPRNLDPLSLAKYLHFGYIPAPSTIYAGVKKLRPAEYLVYRQGKLSAASYWDMPRDERSGLSFEGAKRELSELLQASVRTRLVSDVPLGIFLSGGIDSATVAAMAASSSSSRVKTFTISFSEKDYDESADARLVARHLDTEHHEESFSPETLLGLLPVMADILDEPLADPSILPTYLLSRFTRGSVTVALGGDGGDEIFGGYPTYYAHRLYERYRRLPGFVRAGIRAAVERLPVSTKYFSFDFKAKRFIRGDGFALSERHARWMSAFLPEEIGPLFTPGFAASVNMDGLYEELNGYAGATVPDPLKKAMYLDAKMYLQDDVLVKVDRASMAVSLEVRAPFLDREVVEFASTLPASWKLNGKTSKYILRETVKKLLPPEVLKKKKQGFALPLSRWFRRELTPLLDKYLDAGRLEKEGIFRPDQIGRLVSGHRNGRQENSKMLWALLVFEMWKERYG